MIRTLPNGVEKRYFKYSNNPGILYEAVVFIRERIKHLLIDLPSVDKEHDEGKLLAHGVFGTKDVAV